MSEMPQAPSGPQCPTPAVPGSGLFSQPQLDMTNRLQTVLSNYHVRTMGQNLYKAEQGTLAMNILCGCCAQYYAFEIQVFPHIVGVNSTVPCGGCWGGAIGVAKNKDETKRVTDLLNNAFRSQQIYHIPVTETMATTISMGPSAPTMMQSDPPAIEPQQVTKAIQVQPDPAVTQSAPPVAATVAPQTMQTPIVATTAAPQSMQVASADRPGDGHVLSKTVTKINVDGSKTVTKETTNPDGSKVVQVTNHPAPSNPQQVKQETREVAQPQMVTDYPPTSQPREVQNESREMSQPQTKEGKFGPANFGIEYLTNCCASTNGVLPDDGDR